MWLKVVKRVTVPVAPSFLNAVAFCALISNIATSSPATSTDNITTDNIRINNIHTKSIHTPKHLLKMASSSRPSTQGPFAQNPTCTGEISRNAPASTRRQRRHAGHRTSQPPTTKPPPRPLIEQLPELIPHLQLHTESSSNEATSPTFSTFSPSLTSQHTGTSQSEPERLSLLGLPGELRNQIFRYVVVHNRSMRVDFEYTGRFESLDASYRKVAFCFEPLHRTFCRLAKDTNPPLTKVSRQIRREALSLLIQENNFQVIFGPRHSLRNTPSPLRCFLTTCDMSGSELQSFSVRSSERACIAGPCCLDSTHLLALDFAIAKREQQLQFTAILLTSNCTHKRGVDSLVFEASVEPSIQGTRDLGPAIL